MLDTGAPEGRSSPPRGQKSGFTRLLGINAEGFADSSWIVGNPSINGANRRVVRRQEDLEPSQKAQDTANIRTAETPRFSPRKNYCAQNIWGHDSKQHLGPTTIWPVARILTAVVQAWTTVK